MARKELRRDGVVVPIAPKPLELLLLLVRNRERMVSRQEALAAVWPDVRVSAATLSSTLRDLRRAIGDDAQTPVYVQTARGLGFRFVAPVEARRARSATAEPGATPLVGRDALLERLDDALTAAAFGRGAVVLLEGAPGVGKTRVLSALAARARENDCFVGHARFPEAGVGEPYRPWGQLLETLVASRPLDRLEAELGSGRPWLARLVPALSPSRHAEPPPESGDEGAELRLFDAVATFLRRVAREKPLLLVLDDLHGADRSSLRLLEFLADEIRDDRLLIVGAYRSCELDPEHPLPATLAELARNPRYVRHRLEGVDREATRALVLAATGSAPDDGTLAVIHQRTDGNPFYVHELASYLAGSGAGAGAREVPPGLRELLRGRLQRLPLRCRATLELAAVAGSEFEIEILRRASGFAVADLVEALEGGRRAGLVELDWGDKRRFSHVLVQEAIYAGIPEPRRRLLHRAVGEAHRTLASPDRGERLASAAHHLCQVAEDVGAPALEAATAAAEHAAAQLAFDEAQDLYALALDALDRIGQPDGEQRCRLLLGLARAQLLGGDVGRAVATARGVAALAREIARTDLLAEAVLLFAHYVLLDSTELQHWLQEALARLGPEHEALRGRCMAALSIALWYERQSARRLALADEALAIARRAERPGDVVDALLARHGALKAPQHLAERLRIVDQAFREASRHDNAPQRCTVLSWRAADLMESGDRAAAERDVAQLEEIARAAKLRRFLDHPCRWRALFALAEGRFDDAERWIDESALWRQRADVQDAESYALIQRTLVQRERGRQAELALLVRHAPWLEPYRARLPLARAATALIELEGGQPAAARRLLAGLAAEGYRELEEDPDQLNTGSWLAEMCARLGAREIANALYERLAPWRDQCAGVYAIVCRGSMARYVGLLAATAGRHPEAEACFEAALAANRGTGVVLYEAWTLWEHARLLSEIGDGKRAETLAAQARALAAPRGMGKLLAEIERGGPPVVPPDV